MQSEDLRDRAREKSREATKKWATDWLTENRIWQSRGYNFGNHVATIITNLLAALDDAEREERERCARIARIHGCLICDCGDRIAAAIRRMGEGMSEFKRENRYMVLKRKDLKACLTATEISILDAIAAKVDDYQKVCKAPFECVVVESDWPEYEIVWQMIQDRMEGKPNELSVMRTQLVEYEQICIDGNERGRQKDNELATLRARLADEERKNTNLRHGLEEMEREKNAAHRKGYSEGLAYIRARLTEVEAERDKAKIEAELLATSIWRQFYKDESPNWELCDSVPGVITQIDNMVAGLAADLTQARAALAEMTERARELGEAIIKAHETRHYSVCDCPACTIAREVVKEKP